VGLGLVIVAMASGVAVGRPASKRLFDAVSNGDRVEATVAGAQLNRVLSVEGLLWVGALATMMV
jgi:hypothetical protein